MGKLSIFLTLSFMLTTGFAVASENLCTPLEQKYTKSYSIDCEGPKGKTTFNVSPSYKAGKLCKATVVQMKVKIKQGNKTYEENNKMNVWDIFLNTFIHKAIGKEELHGTWENLKGQEDFINLKKGAKFSGKFKIAETNKIWNMSMELKEVTPETLVIHTQENTDDDQRNVIHTFNRKTGKVTSQIDSKKNGKVKCVSSEG